MKRKREEIRKIQTRLTFSWFHYWLRHTHSLLQSLLWALRSMSPSFSRASARHWLAYIADCLCSSCTSLNESHFKNWLVVTKLKADSLLFLILLYSNRYFIILIVDVWAQMPMESRREHWSPWSGSYRCLGVPERGWCWVQSSGPLQEQQTFLTVESYL